MIKKVIQKVYFYIKVLFLSICCDIRHRKTDMKNPRYWKVQFKESANVLIFLMAGSIKLNDPDRSQISPPRVLTYIVPTPKMSLKSVRYYMSPGVKSKSDLGHFTGGDSLF